MWQRTPPPTWKDCSVGAACVGNSSGVFVNLAAGNFSITHLKSGEEITIGDLRGLAVPQAEMTFDEDCRNR
ncbi:hypothetical protein N2603_41000 [Bradyrhizobium huanghuaihaiense]|uniref:hypothetical protein n=1 Tax=Bradyrhizobium huanghuaihaiense TaxID=990078 RepID=UPI0021AAE7C9|nr:hypothetical protein [Bradyrhizobium sp. CB3035]UWU76195.1 hypothetical protein N2603_41000 [Bradyrhizobium sp. CB3035]